MKSLFIFLIVLGLGLPVFADSLYTSCKSKAQLTIDNDQLNDDWKAYFEAVVAQDSVEMLITATIDTDLELYRMNILYDAINMDGQTTFESIAYKKSEDSYSFVGMNNSLPLKITGTLYDCREPGDLD